MGCILTTSFCNETYKYCDATSGLEVTTNVGIRITTTPFISRDEVVGNFEIVEYSIIYEIVAGTTINSDNGNGLSVDLFADELFSNTSNAMPFDKRTIPNGQSTLVVQTLQSKDVIALIEDDNFPEEEAFEYEFRFEPQSRFISCTPAPPSCTFELTGSTNTSPTQRGASDGAITLEFSGATGTTVYNVNNGVFQSSPTFTSLVSGDYLFSGDDGSGCLSYLEVFLPDGAFATKDFVVTESAAFLASENPIVTTINTEVIAINPQFSESRLTVNNALAVVDGYSIQFDLVFPDYNKTYIAKNFPNRGDYFMTDTLTDRNGNPIQNNDAELIAASLTEVLQNDLTLSNIFYITLVGNGVHLKAKESAKKYDLTFNNVIIKDATGTITTDGINIELLQTGIDRFAGSIVDDYSIYLETHVDVTAQYEEALTTDGFINIGQIELPFNILTNEHRFDTSEICKSYVETTPIDFNFSGHSVLPNMIKPFFFAYGEKFPVVANENTVFKRPKGQTSIKWVLNSSLDYEVPNNMAEYQGTNNIKFLTNSPNPKDIQRVQQEFLYFIVPKDYGKQLDVIGDIEYYDGSTEVGITFFNISTAVSNTGGVYALNVGYEKMGLSAYELAAGSKIKRITLAVWQDNGGSQYTEKKEYFFEILEIPSKFGVAFENRLGGYDTFDFVGETEVGLNRDAATYTKPRIINRDGSSTQGFKNVAMYNNSSYTKLTVNSGWVNQETFDWLQEMLTSNNIYSYTTEYQFYLNVVGYSYNRSSLNDLYSMDVTFEKTIIQNNITV